MDEANTPPCAIGTVAEPTHPDAKTGELFDLLDLGDAQKREEFKRFASVEILATDLPAHFRLDCLTAVADADADAELA